MLATNSPILKRRTSQDAVAGRLRFFRHAAQIIDAGHAMLAEKLLHATPHRIRHTHAAHAIARGVELSPMRDDLRYTSSSTK